jgi:hypothetical protein
MHPESFLGSQFLLSETTRVLKHCSSNAESKKRCMDSVFRVRKKRPLRCHHDQSINSPRCRTDGAPIGAAELSRCEVGTRREARPAGGGRQVLALTGTVTIASRPLSSTWLQAKLTQAQCGGRARASLRLGLRVGPSLLGDDDSDLRRVGLGCRMVGMCRATVLAAARASPHGVRPGPGPGQSCRDAMMEPPECPCPSLPRSESDARTSANRVTIISLLYVLFLRIILK